MGRVSDWMCWIGRKVGISRSEFDPPECKRGLAKFVSVCCMYMDVWMYLYVGVCMYLYVSVCMYLVCMCIVRRCNCDGNRNCILYYRIRIQLSYTVGKKQYKQTDKQTDNTNQAKRTQRILCMRKEKFLQSEIYVCVYVYMYIPLILDTNRRLQTESGITLWREIFSHGSKNGTLLITYVGR